MVDQLARDYANQPVLFLEYDVDNAPAVRYSRFWVAHGGSSSVLLPIIVVDSGNQITNGPGDFKTTYTRMVDTALARAPQAEIQAVWRRVDNHVVVDVVLTNRSGKTLNATNDAGLHAVVYETRKVKLTDRFARTVVSEPISASVSWLAPDAVWPITLTTSDLEGVDWDKLGVVIIADYRPIGATGAYDTLQAASAEKDGAILRAGAGQLTFLADPAAEAPSPQAVAIQGAANITWTASSSATWLTVTPTTGNVGTNAVIGIALAALAPGWQQGTVTYLALGGRFSTTVTVDAFQGVVHHVALPEIAK